MTRLWPSARARSISSAAAPSTLPPLTDTAIRPSSARTSTAPSGRGALPNVRITTARPLPTPAAVQSSSVSSSSFIGSCLPSAERVGDIGVAGQIERSRGRDGRERPDRGARLTPAGVGRSRGLAAPPDVARPDAGEDLAEALEAGDRPGRDEVVDVRHRRAHPTGERLVAGRAGERVQPDEPMAVPPEAGRLGGDEGRIAAVPAVGDHDHDPRGPQRAAGPVEVEVPERLADPRPAGPVVDRI